MRAPLNDSGDHDYIPPVALTRELLVGNRLSVLLRPDRDLPGAAGTEIALAFVHSVAFVAGIDDGFHRGHSHRRHCGHEEGHGHVGSRDRLSILSGQLHANGVAALVRRIGIGRQFHIGLLLCRGIHRSRLTGAGRRRNKRTRSRLQLRFGINQEVCRGDDLFFGLDAFRDHEFIADLRPQLDFARLDVAFAAVDKNQVLGSGMKSCAGGDHQLPAHRQLGANIHIHSRSQLQTGIRKHQAALAACACSCPTAEGCNPRAR